LSAYEGRFGTSADLRGLAADGAIVTGVFHLGVAALTLLRGFAVAALVTPTDYGVWGLLGLAVWTALAIRSLGVNEKYVQQSEGDQILAFQRAFTIELIFAGVAAALLLGIVPAMATVTGRSELLAPGLVLVALLPAGALQFPIWAFHRRMDFRTQRKLQALEPLAATVVTVVLATLGAGYWSFVGGVIAGAWAAAAGALRHSPYPLALRYDRAALRTYLAYSWPLVITGVGVLVVFQVVYLVGSDALGIAALGAFTLAGNIIAFSDRADAIVTEALFPALCAVRDRTAVLFEAFVKSNRLALMWAAPFGVALSLFAGDLVDFVVGERWAPAVGLLQIMGVVTAVRHVGFNWHAFYRARGDTRPIAASAVIGLIVFVGAAVPLMYAHGLVGLAWAFAVAEAAALAIRSFYLRRLFPGFRMTGHFLRALAPTAAVAALILAVRTLESGERTAVEAAAELGGYVLLVTVASVASERALLREALALVRRRRPASA
jgi:PST family polysaccharide transporter